VKLADSVAIGEKDAALKNGCRFRDLLPLRTGEGSSIRFEGVSSTPREMARRLNVNANSAAVESNAAPSCSVFFKLHFKRLNPQRVWRKRAISAAKISCRKSLIVSLWTVARRLLRST
jgi:hypothetical protein